MKLLILVPFKMVKCPAYNVEDPGSIPRWGRSSGEEIATHSSTLAWKIPWTEEPGRLHSPWGRKQSDMTEQLNFLSFFSFSGVQ